MKCPSPFLELIIHHGAESGGDNSTLCAGFESEDWRCEQLADHMMEWLPEFALTYSEVKEMGANNALKMVRKAARLVYQTDKYKNRGEFGELLLHIAIRQIHNTIPAISKIYYKSAVNETVKGFDAVHIVKSNDELELWIGETKFYKKASDAISDVVPEIVDHLENGYLKREFLLISNKLDGKFPEYDQLKKLLDENTSLDKIFARACIPIFLTYESPVIRDSKKDDHIYRSTLEAEVKQVFDSMRKKLDKSYFDRYGNAVPVTVHVILLPLKDKSELISALDL